ncbi:MAG: aquaporin [Planctomycetales bacterium]|nr:aquaporin [Planctomycetales bacterium]
MTQSDVASPTPAKVVSVVTPSPSQTSQFLAEVAGTFLLILFGCGSVHASVLMDAQAGVWQVAIVWGVSIMLAIYMVGAISGAHINPAITFALAMWGRFDWSKVPMYVAAQLLGAMLAAACLFGIYHPYIAQKESQKQVVRGEPGSVITAMCYGEYFPNPGALAGGDEPLSNDSLVAHWPMLSHAGAFGIEVLGTAILAAVVFAVTDPRNMGAPGANLAPVFIGLTVAALISVLAPLTQACFNPARDFGPRLFAYFAGWGAAAIPGPNGIGFLTVYIVAPIVGACAGAGIYERLIRPGHGPAVIE